MAERNDPMEHHHADVHLCSSISCFSLQPLPQSHGTITPKISRHNSNLIIHVLLRLRFIDHHHPGKNRSNTHKYAHRHIYIYICVLLLHVHVSPPPLRIQSRDKPGCNNCCCACANDTSSVEGNGALFFSLKNPLENPILCYADTGLVPPRTKMSWNPRP
jgi:hypothetical protein